MKYLYVKIVNGLYDLWLLLSDISVPQKSFLNTSDMGVVGKISLFFIMASLSSKTNVPNKVAK